MDDATKREVRGRRPGLMPVLLVSLLLGCSAINIEARAIERSTAETRSSAPGTPIRLWGTIFYIHHAKAATGPNAVPLRNRAGHTLGVALSVRDWCLGAREGTVAIRRPNGTRTFNHAGFGARRNTNCAAVLPGVRANELAMIEHTSFMPLSARAPFGLSSDPRFRLVPYRTVATDTDKIPLGSVLYIPALRGRAIHGGVHDGYVFAADTGVGVGGNHIDFFTGTSHTNPAPGLFAGTSSVTFTAYRIRDPIMIKKLRQLHWR